MRNLYRSRVAAAAIVVSLAPFFTIAAHLKLEGALLPSHLINPCKLLDDRRHEETYSNKSSDIYIEVLK